MGLKNNATLWRIILWPLLLFLDAGICWSGVRTWRQARNDTRRALKEIKQIGYSSRLRRGQDQG